MSYTYKNWCKTPIFESGSTGYWAAGPGATLSTSTDKFVTGRTKSLKMTFTSGSPTGSVLAVTPTGSAGIPVRMGEALRFSAWGASGAWTYSGGGTHVLGPLYLRGHIQDAVGTILQTVQYQVSVSDSGTSMVRSAAAVNLTANQAGYLVLDVFNAGNSDGGSVYLDGIQVELRDEYSQWGSAAAPFFSGASAADVNFTYAWDGAADNSYSTATMIHSVSGPAVATIGSPTTVTGSGFVAGEVVTVEIRPTLGTVTTVSTTADGLGNISCTGTPPAGTVYPGKLEYNAIGASDTLKAKQLAMLRTPAPAASTTVTNLFPNPEVVTLADATRPKHFWQWYDAPAVQITQSGAAGAETARLGNEPVNLNTGLTLGETFDSAYSCGVSAGKGYMFSATITTPVDLTPDEGIWLTPDAQFGDDYQSNSSWGLAAGSARQHAPFYAQSNSTWASLYAWTSLNADREVFVDKVQITEITEYYRGFLPTFSGTVDLAAMGLQAGSSYYLRAVRGTSVFQPGDTFQILAGPNEGSLTAVHSHAADADSFWHEVEIPADAVIIRAVGALTKVSLTWPWQMTVFDAPQDYFSGATTDGGGYTYDWAGTAHDSASTRTEAAGLTGQVFIAGAGVAFSEARVVVAGSLVNITEIGT